MQQDLPDLTAEQYKALKKNSAGYWRLQFAACILFVALGSAGVVATWGFGFSFDGDGYSAGDGLMAFFTAAAFAGGLVYLLRTYQPGNELGRLRYTWTIRQTGQAPEFRTVNRDVKAMSLANKASRGTLTADELAGLQAFDPDFPYPWRIPPRT